MFAQQPQQIAGFDSRKRLRDEELEMISCGFGEHRNKRLALPVRTSPNAQPWNAPAAIQEQAPHYMATAHGGPVTPTTDGDLDMVMDAPQDTTSFTTASARQPTPMQPTFAGQVSGATTAQLNGVVNMGHVHSAAIQDRSVPRTMQTGDGCDGWPGTMSHRMPSPISEDDGMVDAANVPAAAPQAFPNNHPRQPGNYEPYDPDENFPPLGQTNSAPATPSPVTGRSPGHIRSRHTLNNWTQQAGMKKTFSIGYRADCDKCLAKVPGHFNHIVIS